MVLTYTNGCIFQSWTPKCSLWRCVVVDEWLCYIICTDQTSLRRGEIRNDFKRMTQIVFDKQTEATMLIRYYCSEEKIILWKRHPVSENVIITIDKMVSVFIQPCRSHLSWQKESWLPLLADRFFGKGGNCLFVIVRKVIVQNTCRQKCQENGWLSELKSLSFATTACMLFKRIIRHYAHLHF